MSENNKLPEIKISDMLDAGLHFGHRTARWNPKMAQYIHGIKDNIHIIDLRYTQILIKNAMKKIFEVASNNGKILFVGTKYQARDIVASAAEKCGQYYISNRWLGGTMTNWATISDSIKTLQSLEKTLDSEDVTEKHTKKEILGLERKKDKLLQSLGGIREMGGNPDLIIAVDIRKEKLALKEAKNLGIPVVAMIDTNADPDAVQYPVPANDDAIRSIEYCCDTFANTILAGIEAALIRSGVDVGALSGEKEAEQKKDEPKDSEEKAQPEEALSQKALSQKAPSQKAQPEKTKQEKTQPEKAKNTAQKSGDKTKK